MDIIFKGRRTDVQERFRKHASAKLGKLSRLDHRAIRVDVEVSTEPNPRQAERRERVELTIRSRGPVIRAEAAADDRYAALDRAFAKLEARLRRLVDRRKSRHGPAAKPQEAKEAQVAADGLGNGAAPDQPGPVPVAEHAPNGSSADATGDVIPIHADGDCPVVVREKFHPASPMTIDQALLEMELVGHDFYLFRDQACGHASVVYRRHGYQYGLIRLVEEAGAAAAARPGRREV